jgi:plastocyanin
MRRLSSAVALVIVVPAALAACTSSSAPSWTYAPAPSVTPAPSGGASGSPPASEEPTAGPTQTAEPSETAGPSETAEASGSAAPGGLAVAAPVGASVTGYEPRELVSSAGLAFTITFDNQDTGVPHNFVLKDGAGQNVDIGDTAFFNGPGTRTYNVPALDAGEYPFLCEVHPNTMTGVLTVQ